MATSPPAPDGLPLDGHVSTGRAGYESVPPASAGRGPTGPPDGEPGGSRLIGSGLVVVIVSGLVWFLCLNVFLLDSVERHYEVTQTAGGYLATPLNATPRPVEPFDRRPGDLVTALMVAGPAVALGVAGLADRRRGGSLLAGVALLSMATVLVAAGAFVLTHPVDPYCTKGCLSGFPGPSICDPVPCPADAFEVAGHRRDAFTQRATVLVAAGALFVVSGIVVLVRAVSARRKRHARSDEATSSPTSRRRSAREPVAGFLVVALFGVLPLACVSQFATGDRGAGPTTASTAPTTTTHLPAGGSAPQNNPPTAAPGAGTSLANPLPVGSGIEVDSGWVVQVNSAQHVDDALLVNLSARNGSDQTGSVHDHIRLDLIDPTGRMLNPTASFPDRCSHVRDELKRTAKIAPGAVITGNVCFPASGDAAATALLLAYPPPAADSEPVFRVFSLGSVVERQAGDDCDAVRAGSKHLARAHLTQCDLQTADLSGADLPDADLTGADLANADLAFANLRGADLTGAGLQGVDLTDADLSGARLAGADLTGVVWKSTRCPDGTPSSVSTPETCNGHGI